jgi:ketosteroid isomerase-like protein
MSSNTETIENFYRAFQKRDHAGMVACYHPEVEFSDPVFQNLKGPQAGAMWQMLLTRSKDMTMTYSQVQADTQQGLGYWEATYTYSATGRKVLNKIHSSFRFKDGKIIEHHDSFNLWRWSAMALGVKGLFLGWLPPVQNSIRKNARTRLDEFMAQ